MLWSQGESIAASIGYPLKTFLYVLWAANIDALLSVSDSVPDVFSGLVYRSTKVIS